MNDAELSQTLKEAYDAAPPVVQKFVTSGNIDMFVGKMQEKYQLHVDVAGRLSNEVLMLLLGITSPNEIIQVLAEEVLIPNTVLEPLMKDMNEMVFKFLRAQEQTLAPIPIVRQEPSRPQQAPVPPLAVQASVLPAPIPPPPPAPMMVMSLPQELTAPIAPPPPAPVLSPAPTPEPIIPVQKTVAPPPNLPGVPPMSVPLYTKPVIPPIQATAPVAPAPIPAPAPKAYVADPYRELPE